MPTPNLTGTTSHWLFAVAGACTDDWTATGFSRKPSGFGGVNAAPGSQSSPILGKVAYQVPARSPAVSAP